jgi:hypothetical protein
LLFFGDRTQPDAVNKINGNATTSFQGAIYFPSQYVQFLGNFGGNHACLQVIADRIDYTGNATFNSNCAGTGVKQIITVGNIKLVE